jgi:hypothetical protein
MDINTRKEKKKKKEDKIRKRNLHWLERGEGEEQLHEERKEEN